MTDTANTVNTVSKTSAKTVSTCPCCAESMRTDILVRHLSRKHLSEIAASMHPDRKKMFADRRLPILTCETVGSKYGTIVAMVCAVCSKGSLPSGRHRNWTADQFEAAHSKCKEEFSTYEKYFTTTEPRKLIDPDRPSVVLVTTTPPALSAKTCALVRRLAGAECPDLDDVEDVVGYLVSALEDAKMHAEEADARDARDDALDDEKVKEAKEELLEMQRINERLEGALEKIVDRYNDDDTEEPLRSFLSGPEWSLVQKFC